jgi:hypothetical protein
MDLSFTTHSSLQVLRNKKKEEVGEKKVRMNEKVGN